MQLINNWATTLEAPAAAAVTELTVPSPAAAQLGSIGSGENYVATLARVVGGVEVAWEIVHITGVSAEVLSVQRGQEGTEALDWLAGESISIRATAGLLEPLLLQITSLASALEALEARVAVLEGGEPQALLNVTVGVQAETWAGYEDGLGSCSPDSLEVPGLGTFPIFSLGFFDGPSLYVVFTGQFDPLAIQSFDVEGAGVFLVSEAVDASSQELGGVWYTLYEWAPGDSDWFSSDGQTRSVAVNFAITE